MPIKVYRVLHKSGAWSRLAVTATKGLTLGDSAEAKLDKLERVLAGYHWPLTEVIPQKCSEGGWRLQAPGEWEPPNGRRLWLIP